MLCYKGSSPVSEVEARGLDFVISDSTPAGPLQIQYSRYDTEKGVFLPPEASTRFVSHIGPSMV